jgi:glycosyltransferase involved in cell wall biosynthesis
MTPALPVTFLITDLHRGGSPLMLAALAAGLKRWAGPEGHNAFQPEVVSIAPAGEVAELLRHAGVPVSSLEAAGNRDVRVMPRFVRHLQQAGPQGAPRIVFSILVHANILAAMTRAWLDKRDPASGLRWVQSIHTVQEKPRWHWVVQGMIGRQADALVAPSRAVLRKLERYGPLPGGGGGAVVIHNGIDVDKFAHADPMPAAACPWPAEAFVVGYLGRFDPVKRIDLLLEAAAALLRRNPLRFDSLHLALVGYGAMEEDLRARAAALGIAHRVHFPVSDGLGLGPVRGTREPERWIKTFNLFCSPSPAEGFGLTLLEARAAGVPVVACRTQAVQEALAGDAGGGVVWIDPECGAADVASALEKAMDRPIRTVPPAEVRAGWSVEHMVERYAAWLLTLARNGAATR